jgi:hypothetical protein
MIKAGYQLHVTTWEGDADAYGTKIISGLTEEDTKFYIAWAKQFVSRHGWGLKGLGNGGNTAEEILQSLQNALDICWPTNLALVETIQELLESEDSGDWAHELLCEDLLGYPVQECYMSQSHFTRVFESFKVFYIPVDIEQVTSKFKEVK